MPAQPAAGTVLSVGTLTNPTVRYNDVSETMRAIGRVASITGPNAEKGEIDVTHLGSTSKEYIADLPDGGTVDFEVQLDFDNAATNFHDVISDDGYGSAQVTRNWTIVNGTTTFDFQGYISSVGPSFEPSSAVTASFSVRLSGAVQRVTT